MLETRGVGDVGLESKGSLEAELLLPQGMSVFFLLKPLTDWMKPTHVLEGNLLYSVSPGLNVNLIENTFTVTFRLVFDQLSGDCGLAKLTHKINRRSRYHFLFTGEEKKS